MRAAAARSWSIRPVAVTRCVSVAAAVIALLAPAPGWSGLIICDAGTASVNDALARIEHSIDPCGESGQVRAVLKVLERCPVATYRICTDPSISRNTFGQVPEGRGGDLPLRIISWNPRLRTELERGCDGDPTKPVERDPTASLLHEIVHAAQDCTGMNPGEHEAEAIRIENIYRRAAGLCQRSYYGDDPLPPDVLKLREAATGKCSTPSVALREAKRRPATPSLIDHAERPDG
jgi:hypothetical protein